MHTFWEAAASVASREFLNTPKKVIAICLLGYLALQVQPTSAATWDDYCRWNLSLGMPCYINYKYSGFDSGSRRYIWTGRTTNGLRMRLTCGYVKLPMSNNCDVACITVLLGNNQYRRHYGTNWFIDHSFGDEMSLILDEVNQGNEFRCSILPITPEDEHCTCGRRNPTRIVGGVETGVNEYPMMAGIIQKDEGQFCGATIISQHHLITAAHCVYNRNIGNLAVIVGAHNVSKGASVTSSTQIYRLLSTEIHPGYNSGSAEDANDIAILKINGTITFSDNVGPVCLPFRYAGASFDGKNVTALGWGHLEFGGPKSDTLQKVNLTVISSRTCYNVYKTDIDKTLCTFTPGKDACQMDSGGPCLVYDAPTASQVLAGVISGGRGCAGDEPGINQLVSAYIDFILDESLDVFYCIK